MSKGRFGVHGGQYMPETLMNAVIELEEAYNHYKNDPEFNAELTELLNNYAGRPSRLYFAEHMTRDLGGAKIYLKREDLNHTGAHKINNVPGQALLAKKHGADYLGVGAMYPTGTKKDATAVTPEVLSEICQAVDIPVVAIGGINKNRLEPLKGTGVDGVAVVSAIFAAEDIEKATRELKEAVREIL